MSELNIVSETLYIPLLGRIYVSKHCPEIFYDAAALSIEEQLPENILKMPGQNQYTYLASAVRSKNMDCEIKSFLSQNPDGIIVNVGCGLETVFQRNDNGNALWFELDLPEVLELRSRFFSEQERDRFLAHSLFDYTWIDIVKKAGQRPVLILASGLFHYFEYAQVVDFIRHLAAFGDARLVFDAVSALGMKGTRHYMKKMGRQDAEMDFCINRAQKLADEISPETKVLAQRKFYSSINFKSPLTFSVKFKMAVSDLLDMVKLVSLKIK